MTTGQYAAHVQYVSPKFVSVFGPSQVELFVIHKKDTAPPSSGAQPAACV